MQPNAQRPVSAHALTIVYYTNVIISYTIEPYTAYNLKPYTNSPTAHPIYI